MGISRRGFCQLASGSTFALVLPTGCSSASRESDGLPRARPESQGIDPAAILAFLDEVAAAGLELHGLMLARGGAVLAEGWWWPYRADQPHMMHSLTKSVTACGVGLAIEEGRFALDDKVVSFFSDELPTQIDDNLAAMSVRDLLTMRHGHESEVSGAVWRPIKTSWVAEFFKIPVIHRPGTTFVYSSAASFMLSAIITKTTGQTLRDYLEPRLFRPLGIRRPSWDVGPGGINSGGNGLSWTTADSLKLGMLHVQDGVWQGARVLPAAWVREATRTQVPEAAYGFHWRRGPGDIFFGSGQFTQLVIGFPSHETAMAVTAAIVDRELLLPIVWKHFPAAFGGPLANREPSAAELRDRLANARLLPPTRPSSSPLMATISGRSFRAEPNPDGIEAVAFRFEDGECLFSMRDGRGEHRIRAGLGAWIEGDTSMTGNKLHHQYQPDRMRVVAAGQWLDDDSLEMTWQFVETAFRDRVLCRFNGSSLTLDRSVNMNSADTAMPTLRAVMV